MQAAKSGSEIWGLKESEIWRLKIEFWGNGPGAWKMGCIDVEIEMKYLDMLMVRMEV